jgi:serine protease Do
VSEEGIILTNKHVVSDPNAEYTVILHDGTEYNAQVLAFDPINDLAIIQIKA